MAGTTSKKRTHHESAAKSKGSRPVKKQRKQAAYHSDSDDDNDNDAHHPDADADADASFQPVNLLDSDDEGGLDATVDDGASSADSDAGSGSDSDDADTSSARQKLTKRKAAPPSKRKLAQDAPAMSDDDDDDGDDNDEFDLSDSDDDGDAAVGGRPKSKRNDASAFATSMSKILGTKLSTTRRADPLLSRSADAAQASREMVDAALEAKARRQMRQQKLAALEKGRVRDVLVASRDDDTGELEASTADILETERRLRKVAQRGVVKLFNAVRAAQVRGADAEVQARRDGFVGVKGREEKVSEMSRKGFLDLIASGGGGMKTGGIQEA
ncbi:hypothetical protein JX266_005444 [Neoarthrinium moseri]|nr:hypothetical protein JX266_005444 [Neoarthrinium moseri]